MQIQAPAGWYPDPAQRHAHRYWSGAGWSHHVADAGTSATDPLATDALENLAPPDPEASDLPVAVSPGGYRVGPCDPGIPLFTMLAQASGTLQLAFGRLRFTTTGGRVVFDLPLSELHSLGVGELGTAIDVWHGDKRHRVSLAGPPEFMLPSAAGADPLIAAMGVESGVKQTRREREKAQAWKELLEPYIAPQPPPGVKVRRPMGNVAYAASVGLLVLLTTAAIVAATFLVAFSSS
jgi:hypothetical protein